MSAQSENKVVIDTSINTDSFLKAFARLQQAAGSFATGTGKELNQVDKSIDAVANNASKLTIDPTTDGIEDAVRELDVLNATIENQNQQLGNYRSQYERVCERYGSTSDEALKLERKILQLEQAIQKNTKRSDEYADTLRDTEEEMNNTAQAADTLEQSTKDSGNAMEQGGKSSGVFNSALGNLIANGISQMVGALGNLLEKTQEFRRDLSFLEQNSRDAGVSLDYLHGKSAELYAITGDTNEVVEALSNVMASGFTKNGMSDAIDLLAGAVVKFPETIKIESLADSLQETIATGEATGQYAELLGRLGIDVEKFNEKMGRTSSEAGRQRQALDVLSREGLDTLWESYRKNNGQLMENAKANYELQLTYADLSRELEPLETMLKTTIAQVLTDNRDKIVKIIDALGGFLEIGANVLGFLSDMNPILLLVGGGLALIVIKAAGVAVGANIMAGGVASATKTLALAGPAAATAGAQFLLLSTNILMVAAAVWLVTSGIAALINAIRGVPQNLTINTNGVPNMKDLRQSVGYAGGTRSASPGWHWVGENGPELRSFVGGEQVLTAAQSTAMMQSNTAAIAGASNTYVDRRSYVFKVDDIGTYEAILRKHKNEQMNLRQGWVEV